jgi:hypothetical protein
MESGGKINSRYALHAKYAKDAKKVSLRTVKVGLF